ncbi:hypothetical protein QJS66_06880 [Kocuria rhizophila]|nr:hypothetical protein QJS66_06880 [Kocuria rhizophila]
MPTRGASRTMEDHGITEQPVPLPPRRHPSVLPAVPAVGDQVGGGPAARRAEPDVAHAQRHYILAG